jgi:hypothetical protein
MGRPVEIEFAVSLDQSNKTGSFYLLQIRPIVDSKELVDDDMQTIADEETIINCNNALGHGITSNVFDVVYVRPESFNAANNNKLVSEIDDINKKLLNEGKGCILIGPGRWGSNDPNLGIPIKWQHISSARVIVEAGLTDYRIEPSQGTHFFQNLTSFGVGYFTVNPYLKDGYVDFEFLNSLPALQETECLRHVRLNQPFIIKIDGRKSKGVVLKPIAR